ncbi:hypothetical protein [Cohnella cholangitidis]|uniref:Uncharacterized protein n=1 Tax=Cohnella cholangitidis TaxID=2598458 RepID=A0A7G5BZK3_9BACL|nr:hypothetical protein [Cohnella cholangitidis]QMV42387.1 hypothetical protein FPL14_15165 [Cohnella cholangitidis]
MRSTRFVLILSYFLLGLWWLTYWVCTQIFIIAFPPVFLVHFGLLVVFPVLSIILFDLSKKWLSETRIVACLLLIPLIWAFLGSLLVAEVKHRIIPPNEAAVRDFIHRGGNAYIDEDFLNMSEKIVHYRRSGKILELHARFQSHPFLEWFLGKTAHLTNEPLGPDDFISYVRRYYIFPEGLSSVTVVPKQIVLYGYWDNTLIVGYTLRVPCSINTFSNLMLTCC